MRRKSQMRNLGITLLVFGAGAVGVMVGAVLFIVRPDLVPGLIPPTTTPTEAPILPTLTPIPSWYVTYQYRFGDSLASGTHGYRMSVACAAGEGAGAWEGTFQVDSSVSERPARVYLRASGMWDAPVAGSQLSAINPEQLLGAALTLEYPTLEQSEAARADCSVVIQLDGGSPNQLEPGIPEER
jgi:hypothetical protein